jgi:iron complex transport system substrate-binding protein
LQDSLIGLAGNYTELPPALAATAQDIPELGSDMSWPSKEVMLSQEVSLVVSEGLNGFAFDPAQGYATVADLEAAGAQVISTGSSCNPTESEAKGITAVHDDLRLLATVFGVVDRGEALVKRLQQREAEVTQQVKSLEPVPTVFYNGGEGPLFVLTSGVWQDLIRKAGGRSVFDASVSEVGLEEFANSNAEVILMGTYPGQDPNTMATFLKKTFPMLPAVQGDRLYPIPTIETEASIRIIEGLEKIVRALHPTAL